MFLKSDSQCDNLSFFRSSEISAIRGIILKFYIDMNRNFYLLLSSDYIFLSLIDHLIFTVNNFPLKILRLFRGLKK